MKYGWDFPERRQRALKERFSREIPKLCILNSIVGEPMYNLVFFNKNNL